MNADELLVAMAHFYGGPSGLKGQRLALLVNVSGKPAQWAAECRAVTPGVAGPTPVGKILTTKAKELGKTEFLNGYCLALNYTPTDWCLGLAWLLKVKYVAYPKGPGFYAVKTSTDDVGRTGFPEWNLSSWDWNVVYSAQNRAFSYPALSQRNVQQRDREQKITVEKIINTGKSAREIKAPDFTGVAFSTPVSPAQGFIPMPGNAFRNDLFTRAAFALVNSTWKHGGGRSEGLAGHNIGAVAVGQDDRVLAWAVNVSELSRCFHAESLLVFQLLRKGIDLSSLKLRIYCTLEPCQMCSGMITTMCPGAQVFYGMADPKISNNSLTRKPNGCSQQLSITCADRGETIPSMLNKLREKSKLTDNITGFLDAPRAARPAFSGAQDSLNRTPGQINKFHQNVSKSLSNLNVEQSRQAMALLDVRSAPAAPTGSRTLQALDLATPVPPGRELQWVGSNWKAHLPFLEYLQHFLGSAVMNKV